MTRGEFLEELRQALQGNVSQAVVNENLKYYEDYIITESHKGKTEEEVIAQLGNPRLIAKTIVDTHTNMTGQPTSDRHRSDREEAEYTFHSRHIPLWLFAVLVVLVLIGIIILVGSVLIFMLPFLIILAGCMFILAIIRKSRR